jgi:hypothetical protein
VRVDVRRDDGGRQLPAERENGMVSLNASSQRMITKDTTLDPLMSYHSRLLFVDTLKPARHPPCPPVQQARQRSPAHPARRLPQDVEQAERGCDLACGEKRDPDVGEGSEGGESDVCRFTCVERERRISREAYEAGKGAIRTVAERKPTSVFRQGQHGGKTLRKE